ncbi:MAG: hypothetical protein BIFFINMI_03067 [Phycisphaerae bacterium]|nr:hypothetical protein [Phycisphaerae bacterium]
MHRRNRNVVAGGVLAAAAAVMLMVGPATLSAQPVTHRIDGEQAVRQLRLATLGFVEQGQWASAKAGTEQLLAGNAEDPVGLELRRLLDAHDRVEKTRRLQRQEAYDESATQVAGYIAKQEWEEALAESTRTADLAPEKADLQKKTWYPTLVQKCLQLAQEHKDKGEWLKATAVYSELSSLQTDSDNEYRRMAKKTARFARLEALYHTPEDSAKQINGIDEGMFREALNQVHRFYVTDPDYKKMTVTALECLHALTEVPSLTKAFPVLADEATRKKFADGVDNLRKKAQDQQAIHFADIHQYFVRAGVVNEDTVKLPKALMVREFFDGALDELDPFSSMIWPTEKSEFDKQMNGEFTGVGIQISLKDGQLTVVSPLEDTPAYRAGIQADDVIIAINDESTKDITLNQAVQKITGPANTQVVLTIRRPGRRDPIDFTLVRARIQIQTVKGWVRDEKGQWEYMVDNDYHIGYVRVTNFMRRTVADLEKAIDAMARQNVRGLIIDLRFNPGGLLTQAVEMGDLFIDKGLIVSTRGRTIQGSEEFAHEGGTNTTLPIIVLVNDYSASAAEIVSGALRDTNRAIIVGQRTYGKGSVQNVIPVGGFDPQLGAAKDPPAYMKLTTAYYYLPGGESIHRHEDSKTWGVNPTVEVDVTRDEVQDILDLRRDSDILHRPGEVRVPTTQPDDRSGAPTTQPDHVAIDAQMDAALLVLRAELLKRKL